MKIFKAAICVWVAGVAAGCSSDDSPQITSGVRDSGGDAPASGGSSGAGGSSVTGGSGGSSGSGGSGGGGTLNCEGTFGPPRLLLDAGSTSLASPTLGADELELFYVTYDTGGANRRIRRSMRASRTDGFPLGNEVPELNALCSDPAESAALDLTADGLRAYVSCADTTVLGRMLLARRTSKTTAFAAIGSVASEIGGSAAVNATELTVYSTGADLATPLVATRASTAEPFGTPAPVPGLTGVELVAPDPSGDELVLFGGLGGRQLTVARRSSLNEPFGAPVDISVPLDASGAPHVTADCRRVYFVGITPADAGSTWGIYVIER